MAYWWQKEEQKDSGKQSSNQQTGEQGYWWQKENFSTTIGNNITSRVNKWLENHNNYISNYQKRYAGRKYSYEDSYVKDSGSWLDTISKQKSDFDAEADSILAYMDQYSRYLDADWAKSVRDTLTGARGHQKSILDYSTKDHEWWSGFGSEDLVNAYGSAEDAYKYYQRADGYNKKYTGMNADDIQKVLSTLEDGEEKDWLDSYQWRRLLSESDFDQYSKAGAAIKNPTVTEAESDGRFLWWEWDGADVGNIVTYSRDNADVLAMAPMNNENTQGNYVYRSMKDDEVNIYNYLLAKYGKEKGEEFLSWLMDDLLAREGGARAERLRGIDIPVVEELAIGAHGLLAGVDQWASGARQFLTNEKQPTTDMQYANAVLANSMDGFGKQVYQATNVIGNMLPSIALSKGLGALGAGVKGARIIGAATMSIGAAGNAYADGLEYGMEPWQARTYGTLVGAAEGALEYVMGGIPALRGTDDFISAKIGLIDNSLLRIGAKIGWDVVEEIGEEELQNFLEPAFRAIFTHEYDAPTIDELIETAIVTAISTPVMGGGDTIINDIHASRNALAKYGDKTNDLIQEGLESDINTDSYKLAQKYQQQVQGKDGKGGKAMTGNQIRNLLAANQEQITPKDMKLIQTAAEKRFTDLGQTEDVEKLAELATKFATGGKLSKADKNFLASSKYGSRVANELLPKNIASEGFSTEWAEEIGTKQVNAAAYNKKTIDQVRAIVEQMANIEDPNAYKSLEARVGTEGRFGVAESGQAVIRETNEAIDINTLDVATVGDGQMTFKVADGKEVSAGEIDFADENQSYLVSAVSDIENITPAAATAIMHDVVDTSKPLGAQLNGIDEAYTYGFNGYSVEDLKVGDYAPGLTNKQMMSAYKLGQSARNISDVDADAPIVKMRTAAEATVSKQEMVAQQKSRFESDDVEVYFLSKKDGSITKFDGNTDRYDDKRTATIRATQILSKMQIGGSGYYLYESYINAAGERVYKDENGVEKTAPNGIYTDTNGRIYIDLNAGDDGQGVGLYTLAHELTHFIKARSKKQFKILGDLVTEAFAKTDMSMHERVVAKQELLSKIHGEHVSYTDAYEEVVCDALSTMISDGSFFEKVAEIKVKDKGLFNTMKQFFQKMFAKFKKVYAELTPDQKDAQDIRAMKDMFDRIQTAFAEALVEASDNFHVAMESVVEAKAEPVSENEILTDGAVVTDGEGEKYSIRSMKHDIAEGKMFDDLKAVCGWTDAQVNTLRNQLNALVEYMIPYRDILDMNEAYGREGRRFSPYKPNSDPLYKISMDFSTLCSKRLLTQYVIENLQLRENRPMSAEEQMAIRAMLNEYRKVEKGLQVACAMCYVEAARLKSPMQIQRWLDNPEPHLRNYFAQKNSEFNATVKKAQADFKESKGYDREAPKKDMKPADVKELNKIGPKMRSQYQLSAEEQAIVDKAKALPNSTYLTAGNLATLSETDPVIYAAYTSFVRTATRSKSLETDEPYYYGDSRRDNGNGIVVTDGFIEAVNRENGMRFSSWSDWRIQHLLDYITAVIDNSVRGAAMHGYTKFGEEVRVLGKTGMMFNMSGVAGTQTGLNKDGSLNFSDTESIDANEAIQLRNEFPETAGLQCIGVGDDHIVALLRSDIIDYVIPYHVSGLNAALRRMADIHGWKDYTSTQHAAIDKSIKFDNAVDQEHWHEEPVYSEFFVGYDTGMTGIEAMIASAEKYKQMCKDRGLTPKFNQFASEENYWKLLIDRKMINQQTGNLIKQRAVTPTFDFGTIMEVVDRHVQNYDAGLEKRALNHIVENWDTIPQRIKDLKKGNKAKKSMDTLANQTVAAQPKDGSKYSYRGLNANGIEVYETSQSVMNMSWKDRKAEYLNVMRNEYRGRTAKFERNGHVYYARFDQGSIRKHIFGDNRSSTDGVKALIKAGADGDVFDLVERSRYTGSQKNKKNHTKADYFDYFVKTVQIDGKVFDLVADVEKTYGVNDGYVYTLALVDNTTKKASPALGTPNAVPVNSAGNASTKTVAQPNQKVNKNSDRDSTGKQLTKEQQAYFANSVVRDTDGRLMVMYHGTANGGAFTIFDGDQLGNEARTSQVGQGFYFTNAKAEAEAYTKNVDIYGRSSKGKNPYLHEVYLNITNPFNVTEDTLNLDDVKAVYSDGTEAYFFTNWIPFYLNRKSVNGEVLTKAAVQSMSNEEKVSVYVDYLAQFGTKELLSNMVRAFPYGKQSELLAAMQNRLGYDGIVEEYAPGQYQYVAFSSEQVKSVDNKKPTADKDIRYSERGNAPIFYSQMGKVVEGMKQEKFGASSVISMLRGRGIKAEEIRWSGIQAWLDGKKSVTKAELMEFIKGSMLHIEETMFDGTRAEIAKLPENYRLEETVNDFGDPLLNLYIDGELVDTFEQQADDSIGSTGDSRIWAMDERDLVGQILNHYAGMSYDDAYLSESNGPRWGEYKLNGGENYRELVFKMPGSDYSNQAMEAHWGAENTGVIAHARMQDLDTGNGKMLFIEEIQSDWHNEGHSSGYRKATDKELAALEAQKEKLLAEKFALMEEHDNFLARYQEADLPEAEYKKEQEAYIKKIREINAAGRKVIDELNDLRLGVPDAPFHNNYHEYVLKRLIRMAAEEGYDSIGWTTADIQSDRWSDEFAEGYRIEYDQDIPKFLKKYGKQWGATVGKTNVGAYVYDIPAETEAPSDMDDDMWLLRENMRIEEPGTEVWSMDITPAMKKSVLTEGQAMYSERTGESVSNRHLLANAFEGISQNSVEYKMIQDYKANVDTLNKLEAELSGLNAEIRKIRFGKGEYDAEKLRQIEDKAKRIAKEINRYDKRLLNMEASEPLRKVIERERKKEAEKTKDHVKEIQQNKKVRAEQAELRYKIRKAVRDLDKILNRGNKKLNVKEDMQNVVTKALKAADILFTENYGNYDMLRNGLGVDMSDSEEALVATCTRMLKDLDKMPTDGYDNWQARQEAEKRLNAKMAKLKEVFARERKRLNNTTVSSILGELADAYASLEKSEQSYVQGAYTEAVHNFLKSLQSEVGGAIVKDMTKDQLESIYAAYKMVLTAVRTANKMFNEELKLSREQLGNAVIQEVMTAGGTHGLWTQSEIARSQFNWNNTKPIWVANRIGSDTFGKLMNGLFKGQYNFAVDVEEAKQFKLKMDQKYHPRNWDAEKLYEFESSTGKKFSLNLQQIMSLYAFSKREQAYSHLLNGGFVFDGNSTVIIDEKGRKKTYIHNGATSYKLNEATLNGIINSLTAEQKAYADEMQAYLSDVMGAKGNEVSMKLYGIQMFKEKFYFPLRSSGAYMERAKEAEMKKQQGQINLVNSGFTHAVKPEAKNPIILSGFMDVWAEHCNEMSMYHSMVLPMEDFRKVYNYSTVHDDKFDSASVYQTIQDAYGKAATDYIDQLYRELNAGATVDPRETTFKAFISKFKKASVMLSASVVVQQFSSVGRAYAIIDPKYFTGTKVNSDTKLSTVDEMKKYAPVAIIKEMGGFDTGTKGSAKSYIMAEQYGKGERIQGFKNDEQYRSDLMGYLPAKADEKTWCAIWEAVKRETKVNHPKMDVKSEEFLKLAGERFSEVIEKTQVYDSVLARSANMRSKGAFMAMATAFMAEPTTTINLIEDAIRSGNKNQIARTFGAVAVSIVLNNALASIVYAMRDDDEDETFIEKYFQSFASGIVDDINPMSYYPFLKDIYSLFQGYDVERSDMSVFADLRDALKKTASLIGKDTSNMDDDELAKHYKMVGEVMMSLLDAGCSMFGVPVKNVRRDANGIINAFTTVSKDLTERDTTWNSFWDKVGAAVKDTIPIHALVAKDKPKQDKLYEAIISGDKAYLARLKSGYKTDDAYQNAVRKVLRENDPRIHAAAQAKYEGKTEEYKRIFNQIKNERKFSFDDIMSAINSEESDIKKGLSPEKASSDYSSTDFVNAILVGESNMAQAMKENIIAAKVANGMTQEEAEVAFARSIETATRNAFDSGLLDEAGTEKMLQEYAGMDEEETAEKVSYWAFCREYPDADLTESQVDKYHEFAVPAEIPLDIFQQYVDGTSGLGTIYDEWGDEVQSKRDQVLAVIDSLPLSWEQKDALYLAAGYAESKIWDVPW